MTFCMQRTRDCMRGDGVMPHRQDAQVSLTALAQFSHSSQSSFLYSIIINSILSLNAYLIRTLAALLPIIL